MSSVTIIGTGNMARAIGTLAVAGGNSVGHWDFALGVDEFTS
ncbi:hypothetical protein ACFVWG_20215 [Kribbella sp. NPDC058245]